MQISEQRVDGDLRLNLLQIGLNGTEYTAWTNFRLNYRIHKSLTGP